MVINDFPKNIAGLLCEPLPVSRLDPVLLVQARGADFSHPAAAPLCCTPLWLKGPPTPPVDFPGFGMLVRKTVPPFVQA